MLYPLLFEPILKDKVWGGRAMERLYNKPLPVGQPIGESWEISDRVGDVSVIVNGPLAGKDLRWLMENHAAEVLGKAKSHNGRFPLLVKILDAQQKLSLQVHPPAEVAARFNAEAKTEMWYVTDAAPGGELYVGLKRGVTREQFARKIENGTVEECFHRVPVRKGDTMFLPSGRVHAIGAGLVLFEIQQNSDSTYRVFDWNRVGLDGKPRALQVSESLASIDFGDFEPGVVSSPAVSAGTFKKRELVSHPLFKVYSWSATSDGILELPARTMQIIGVADGSATISGDPDIVRKAGEFCLIPAALAGVRISAKAGTVFLTATAG